MAAVAVVAVAAATVAALGVSGAVAQSQPTVSVLARECTDAAGKWVAIGSDKVITPQQACRARFEISVPKSYTAQNLYNLQLDWGDSFLAPEISRADVLDQDCETPVTTILSGDSNYNDDTDDGTVITPGLAGDPVRILSASAQPATMSVSDPYNNGGWMVDFRWGAWQAGDSDPRVWEVTIDINLKDGVLNRLEYGCFITTDGTRSHVFYRAAIFFEWRLRNNQQPIDATQAVFVVKDNDNGPYSVNHPAPRAAQSRAARTPTGEASGPAARTPSGEASGPAAQAAAVDVVACVLGEAVSRSQWAARLVDCLDLRGTGPKVRLVPLGSARLRFSDIGKDPNRDDIILLARYGLAVGCQPGKFCGDAEPTQTEQMAVLMAAMTYGLIDTTTN